ncbi:hypothetical protein J6590_022796 [Homalodisca vitripennis]|nr:hypothetical protein J6590_022796 [Homalodisca vitripennis]
MDTSNLISIEWKHPLSSTVQHPHPNPWEGGVPVDQVALAAAGIRLAAPRAEALVREEGRLSPWLDSPRHFRSPPYVYISHRFIYNTHCIKRSNYKLSLNSSSHMPLGSSTHQILQCIVEKKQRNTTQCMRSHDVNRGNDILLLAGEMTDVPLRTTQQVEVKVRQWCFFSRPAVLNVLTHLEGAVVHPYSPSAELIPSPPYRSTPPALLLPLPRHPSPRVTLQWTTFPRIMEDVLSGAEGRQMSAPCLPEEGGRFSFTTRDLYTSLDNEQPTTLSLALFLVQYPLFVCVTVKFVCSSPFSASDLVDILKMGYMKILRDRYLRVIEQKLAFCHTIITWVQCLSPPSSTVQICVVHHSYGPPVMDSMEINSVSVSHRVVCLVGSGSCREVKRSEQTTKSLVGLHNKGTTVEYVWEWTLLVSNKDLRRSGELSLWFSHWCENLFYGSS